MIAILRAAIIVVLMFTLLTGVAYPLAVWAVAQTLWPHQANGSLIVRTGKTVGSELIGQQFDDPRFFWGRPSATTIPYDGGASSGSNLGPTNPALLEVIANRVSAIRNSHPEQTGPIPVELVTASASGLDPHISPAAAEFQAVRVARARNLNLDAVRDLIKRSTAERALGLLGEPQVNVLTLNLELDSKR